MKLLENRSGAADSKDLRNDGTEIHNTYRRDLEEFQLRAKPRGYKKTWGIYYTPEEIAKILCEWCIRSQRDHILEPSFGGCGFLNQSVARLVQLGCVQPWNQLCGCDIDQRAFSYLPKILSRQKNRFIKTNFLDLEPTDLEHQDFDAILGNPPYVSRHNMWAYQKKSSSLIGKRWDVRLSKRASLWAYFVIHSCSFLKEQGRMCWVLPQSLSQSVYGRQLLDFLGNHFQEVRVISLSNRLFMAAGAEEATDLLFCSGFVRLKGHLPSIHFKRASSADQIKASLALVALPRSPLSSKEYVFPPRLQTLGRKIQPIQNLLTAPGTNRISDLLVLRIGIVLGATNFFVLKNSELASLGLELNDVSILFTSFSYCNGLEWTHADTVNGSEENRRILLIRSSKASVSNRLEKYLMRFPQSLRQSIKTFKKRSLWHAPDDYHNPDAFLPSLVHDFPRLIFNCADTNATNNVYRVYFKRTVPVARRKLISISLISSLGQMATEIHGNVRGSRGLKLEPRNYLATRLLLPTAVPRSQVLKTFGAVDLLLRENKSDEARETADELLSNFSPKHLYNSASIATVRRVLKELRNERLNSPV